MELTKCLISSINLDISEDADLYFLSTSEDAVAMISIKSLKTHFTERA